MLICPPGVESFSHRHSVWDLNWIAVVRIGCFNFAAADQGQALALRYCEGAAPNGNSRRVKPKIRHRRTCRTRDSGVDAWLNRVSVP